MPRFLFLLGCFCVFCLFLVVVVMFSFVSFFLFAHLILTITNFKLILSLSLNLMQWKRFFFFFPGDAPLSFFPGSISEIVKWSQRAEDKITWICKISTSSEGGVSQRNIGQSNTGLRAIPCAGNMKEFPAESGK